MRLFDYLHEEWKVELAPLASKIDSIQDELSSRTYLPDSSLIFRALQNPVSSSRVLILGQDPYPNPGFACGYAFSVPPDVGKVPKSLQNILREVTDDVGSTCIRYGDLTPWVAQGVILLNRTLTLEVGESLSHSKLGWQAVTDEVTRILNRQGVVNILWGKSAGELQAFTNPLRTIVGVHPSPLSAYRGFFGSKPFSKANALLKQEGREEIIW